MSRRPTVRLPGTPFLDLFSLGRAGPSGGFTLAQIEQIQRTVRRVPEVMLKVTGGGTRVGAVAAHLQYISRKGELTIETSEGDRVTDREAQKALLKNWHLELISGQYPPMGMHGQKPRRTKLVHNIVLSMPSPTPPGKVLAAARKFAREKFASKHRYALVLHTDQQHPHVHMVVKAEDEHGQRLRIDKETLRRWREDFARNMREQGVAANATPRFVRGQNKGKTLDGIYRAGQRGASTAIRQRATDVAGQLKATGSFHDPARVRLLETRKAITDGWLEVAGALDAQGETSLANEVRHFARHMPRALTDKERVAVAFVYHLANTRQTPPSGIARDKSSELTR
jgi:hypothetical protein